LPVRVRNFSIRKQSGDLGAQPGGNGLIREMNF